MDNRIGFITGYNRDSGSGHAVAWNGAEIYDPVGLIYSYRWCKHNNFKPDTFHLLVSGIKA